MKRKTFFISCAAFCMSCVFCVGYGQNHTSAVGVLLPSGKSAYSPLHVHENSSYVKSGGYHMWSTYTQPNWMTAYSNVDINKNLYVYTDGSYPSNYVVHEGFNSNSNPTDLKASSQTWWERRPFGNEQRWGSLAITYMQLTSGGLKLTTTNTPIHGVNTAQLSSNANTYNTLAMLEGTPGGNVPFQNIIFMKRVASGSTYETVRLHDAISTITTNPSPFSNTSTWWERGPKDTIQAWGHKTDTYMTLKGRNLGIGTSTPSERLHVVGNVKADTVKANSILLPENLGIGTTTPAARLHAHYKWALGTTAGNYYRVLGLTALTDVQGAMIYNYVDVIRTTTSASGSANVKYRDAIYTTSTTNPGSADSKTWWDRHAHNNIQQWGNGASIYMTLKGGNLGIGVENPTNKLDVDGTISAKKVVVSTTVPAPDYVFAPDYKLLGLSEVEEHINQHQHLPTIPSAAEMAKEGVDVIDLNFKLLQKVEELTLYVIQLNKEIELLKNEK